MTAPPTVLALAEQFAADARHLLERDGRLMPVAFVLRDGGLNCGDYNGGRRCVCQGPKGFTPTR